MSSSSDEKKVYGFYVEKEYVGKHVKGSKVKVVWKIACKPDLKIHEVELKHSLVFGKREIKLNGTLVYHRQKMFNGDFSYEFSIAKRVLRVSIREDFEGYVYDLRVDGIPFHKLTRIGATELEEMRKGKHSEPVREMSFNDFVKSGSSDGKDKKKKKEKEKTSKSEAEQDLWNVDDGGHQYQHQQPEHQPQVNNGWGGGVSTPYIPTTASMSSNPVYPSSSFQSNDPPASYSGMPQSNPYDLSSASPSYNIGTPYSTTPPPPSQPQKQEWYSSTDQPLSSASPLMNPASVGGQYTYAQTSTATGAQNSSSLPQNWQTSSTTSSASLSVDQLTNLYAQQSMPSYQAPQQNGTSSSTGMNQQVHGSDQPSIQSYQPPQANGMQHSLESNQQPPLAGMSQSQYSAPLPGSQYQAPSSQMQAPYTTQSSSTYTAPQQQYTQQQSQPQYQTQSSQPQQYQTQPSQPLQYQAQSSQPQQYQAQYSQPQQYQAQSSLPQYQAQTVGVQQYQQHPSYQQQHQ